MSAIGGHQRAYKGATDEWLTPPDILQKLGQFDLDPCSPVRRPWDTAKKHYTIEDNGLSLPWFGRVWLNPPYGPQTGIWLRKLAIHGNGIALIFARTETEMFQSFAFAEASAILFLAGRIYFYNVNGSKAKANSGAPSVLIAYGKENANSLRRSGINGAYVELDAGCMQ